MRRGRSNEKGLPSPVRHGAGGWAAGAVSARVPPPAWADRWKFACPFGAIPGSGTIQGFARGGLTPGNHSRPLRGVIGKWSFSRGSPAAGSPRHGGQAVARSGATRQPHPSRAVPGGSPDAEFRSHGAPYEACRCQRLGRSSPELALGAPLNARVPLFRLASWLSPPVTY